MREHLIDVAQDGPTSVFLKHCMNPFNEKEIREKTEIKYCSLEEVIR